MAHKFKLIKDIDRSALLARGIFSSEFSRTKSPPGWFDVCSEDPRHGRRLICDGNVGRSISGKWETKEERTSARFFLSFLFSRDEIEERYLKEERRAKDDGDDRGRVTYVRWLENRPLDYAVVSPVKLPPH